MLNFDQIILFFPKGKMGKEGPAGAYGIKGAAGKFHSYHFEFLEYFFELNFRTTGSTWK